MKRLLIILDGMDDEPDSLSPKNIALMPALDFMRKHGSMKMSATIPDGNDPATDVAMMNILGYNPGPAFSGRVGLEALGAEVNLDETDLCLRCNLICIDSDGRISKSASPVDAMEAKAAIDILNRNFASEDLNFYPGIGYRNLLVIRNCSADIEAVAPHSLIGESRSRLMVKSDDLALQARLNNIIIRSRQILGDMAMTANGISLWAPGRKLIIDHQIAGAVVAGVDLVKGIGKAFGMDVIKVEGATGDAFTDYEGKLNATLHALQSHEFVILHIEAPDEASHALDPRLKKEVLETIDRLILHPILNADMEFEVTIQADHATSSITGKHLDIPVEVITYCKHRLI